MPGYYKVTNPKVSLRKQYNNSNNYGGRSNRQYFRDSMSQTSGRSRNSKGGRKHKHYHRQNYNRHSEHFSRHQSSRNFDVRSVNTEVTMVDNASERDGYGDDNSVYRGFSDTRSYGQQSVSSVRV